MIIRASNGDRHVHIKIKGRSVRTLARAEATALRLLQATPEAPAKTPLGFAGTPEITSAKTDIKGDCAE